MSTPKMCTPKVGIRVTDDIVTRLRRLVVWSDGDIGSEAADEIERLRKELSKWATDMPNRLVCTTHGYEHIYHYGFSDGFECSLCKEGI
jgi:hypothetical protein